MPTSPLRPHLQIDAIITRFHSHEKAIFSHYEANSHSRHLVACTYTLGLVLTCHLDCDISAFLPLTLPRYGPRYSTLPLSRSKWRWNLGKSVMHIEGKWDVSLTRDPSVVSDSILNYIFQRFLPLKRYHCCHEKPRYLIQPIQSSEDSLA